MNVTLQRHCAKHIYVIPEGLRELMSDISREVLRVQPEDMYTFIADYLDALMITRENARIAAKFVQELTECAETIANFLVRTGMHREEADKIVTIIQTAFRAYIEKKGILKEDDSTFVSKLVEEAQIPSDISMEAATIIQEAFHAYKAKKEREHELLKDVIDWRVAARSAIKLYRKTGVSVEEAKRAANLIKAAYKGYYTRRAMLKMKQLAEEESLEDEEMSDEAEKSKSVRIDFTSLVPHVDFVGDITSDMSSRGSPKFSFDYSRDSDSEFVQSLIVNSILSPIGEEKEPVEGSEVAEVAEVAEIAEDSAVDEKTKVSETSVVEEDVVDVVALARGLLEEMLPQEQE